jgi:hypothetical protein
MSHLPSLDVVATGDQMEMDGVPPTAKLVETFFEGNTFLQEDIRQFQVCCRKRMAYLGRLE